MRTRYSHMLLRELLREAEFQTHQKNPIDPDLVTELVLRLRAK